MTRTLTVAIAAVVLAAALAGSPARPAGAASTTRVNVGDNYFVRSTGVPVVTVGRGSRLTFRWVGDNPHNVKGVRVNMGIVCGRTRSAGTCTTPLLNTAGRYTVYCQIHGSGDMRFTLRVT